MYYFFVLFLFSKRNEVEKIATKTMFRINPHDFSKQKKFFRLKKKKTIKKLPKNKNDHESLATRGYGPLRLQTQV